MDAHPHDDYAVEGGICLPVPTAVEPVPAGLAARGRDRADPTELGKGGFGVDPLQVIADEDEHFCGSASLDAVGLDHCRGSLLEQQVELSIVGSDLGIKVE